MELDRVGTLGCGRTGDHRLEGALQVQSGQAAGAPVAHDLAAAGGAGPGAGPADGDAAGPAVHGAGEGAAVVGGERAVGVEDLDPVATRVPLSTPARVWTSVAVTIVLPSACRTLMTCPVVVKLPLPEDRAEALAPAAGRSRTASTGSAASTALSTFIVDSFPAGMHSAWAGLAAKRAVAGEDETSRWKVTPRRRPTLGPRTTSGPGGPAANPARPAISCSRALDRRAVTTGGAATSPAQTACHQGFGTQPNPRRRYVLTSAAVPPAGTSSPAVATAGRWPAIVAVIPLGRRPPARRDGLRVRRPGWQLAGQAAPLRAIDPW